MSRFPVNYAHNVGKPVYYTCGCMYVYICLSVGRQGGETEREGKGEGGRREGGERYTLYIAAQTHTHTHTCTYELVDMDKRRLCYLAYTLQQDMELQAKHTAAMAPTSSSRSPLPRTPPPPLPLPNLESLLEQREREMEQCNMLLLLLLACLDYSLPTDVMKATLETAKLTSIGYVHVHVHVHV